MTSAAFSVNGTEYAERVAVSGGDTVTLALLSTTGVDKVDWSIESNSSPNLTNPTITPSGSPPGASASFTMPAGTNQGYQIKCVVNNGVDSNRSPVDDYTKRGIVGVIGGRGIIPFVLGEELSRHPTYGSTIDLNTAFGNFDPVATFSGTVTTSGFVSEPLTGNGVYTPTSDGAYLTVTIFQAFDDTNRDAGFIRVTPFKVTSGTVSRTGTPAATYSHDLTGGVSVDIDTDGTNIIPEVTGSTGADIYWSVSGQVAYLIRP